MKRCLASLLLICLSTYGARAADWNQWRGPNRNGATAESPPLTSSLPAMGLKPLWVSTEQIPAGRAGGWSSPIVADGRVFLFVHQRVRVGDEPLPKRKFPWLAPDKRGGMTAQEYQDYEVNRRDEDQMLGRFYRYADVVYCMSASTGKPIWTTQINSVYTRFPQSGSPAVVNGKVYVLGAAYTARCLDAESGKELWKSKLPGEFRDQSMQSSFVVADGVAVILSGKLFGLNADTGKVLWSVGEEEARQLHSSPAIWETGDRHLAISNVPGGQTVCVDIRSGEQLWKVASMSGHSSPTVVGDRLLTYGSSRKGGLRCYKLSPAGAEHVWTFNGAADSGSCPVVVGDYAYVQGERRLACVNLETGDEEWMTTLDLGRPRYTSLVAADNKVYYAFDGVLCFAATADAYTQLIKAKIDRNALMADEAAFRKLLGIDQLGKTGEDKKKADRVWRASFSGAGPLPCATPAIVDGKLFVRLNDSVVCYDLRAPRTSAKD
ncbi:MAG: PQQ-binding-like beta-propeller repeat protein [Planctomycetes bacterium]|nr:PQQ-binding-like beta-propeller repeat protein [Planctomycetota bacterium]